ncbi:serum amyloid P-component-like [Discoglossus pictus]
MKMEKVQVWVAFFVGLSGCFAQKDMNDQVFRFYKMSNTSYVRIRPEKDGPFDAITVCLKSYTLLKRPYSLFSMNTPFIDNDFLIFPIPHPVNQISVSVGSKDFHFQLREDDVLEWRSTCVTWESITGLLALWINGKPCQQTVFQKGYRINSSPIIIIGQEQDSYGGEFDATQSFVGEITDVHMWDKVLSFTDIKNVLTNEGVAGNVIYWGSLKYEQMGDVSIGPYMCIIHYSPCNQ